MVTGRLANSYKNSSYYEKIWCASWARGIFPHKLQTSELAIFPEIIRKYKKLQNLRIML
jgi:hypothetical protein